jgi:photosystem II stability/assembly factor-like uncharacterized protein
MKLSLIILIFIAINCEVACGQWTKVYQTDTCNCILKSRSPLANMGFFGHDSGVVCSEGKEGVTAVTLNGALTWDTTQIDPSVINDISGPYSGYCSSFLDVNHIWFCNGAAVCHTNNSGKTWVVDSNRDTSGGVTNCIYFVDSLIGYEGGPGLLLFRTSDGGKNWRQVHSETDSDEEVYQIKFCNPKLGLAICGQFVTLIARTTDSGMTWTNPTFLNGFVGGCSPRNLFYLNPQNAWFADNCYLYHSSDSGQTWAMVSSEIAPQSTFSSICFADSVHGIATAIGGTSWTDPLIVGYTSDGGKSWQTSSIDSEALNGFTSFIDTNTAYVGGFDAVFRLVPGELSVQSSQLTNLKMEVYPNPASETITIITSDAGYTVHLVDILGREILHGTIPSSGSLALDVSSLPSGLYYISDGHWQAKFMKEY